MKNSLKVLAAIAVLASANFAQAQNTSTTTGTINSTVIAAIKVTNTRGMSFGNVVQSGGAASVTLSIQDVTTPSYTPTSVAPGPTQTGTISSARFATTGQAAFTYLITLPVDGTVTVTNGTTTAAVNTFGEHDNAGAPAGGGTFDGTGNDWFSVGATLLLPSGYTAGNYTGSFPVTVAYN